MLSIRPEWCQKIISGEKTIEIRKTRPKLETPFKCYIYCTLPPGSELFTHGGITEYANELVRLQSGEIVYDYGMRLCIDPESRPYTTDNFLCRKVIGEFICNMIMPEYVGHFDTQDQLDVYFPGCFLTVQQYNDYCKGKTAYGWHISDLVIYDKPKELSEFTGIKNTRFGGMPYKMQRPPQSWCYVEELK